MKPLTSEQNRVFNFIISHQKNFGAPPTVREISSALGYKSPNNARQHLRLIEQKGYIKLSTGKARGIEIIVGTNVESGKNEVEVPLVGSVSAGLPITAIENLDGHITLDRTMFDGDGLFTLRIKGDSMIGVGVLDGDIVIVRQQASASNGDIVVVIIDDDATLKRYFRKKDHIILHAENPIYDDIILESDRNVWIAGKMVGVIRKC